jgi:hypothetical protein
MDVRVIPDYGIYKGAGAKCDHRRIGVRARVHANLNLDMRGACVRATQKTVATHTLPFCNTSRYMQRRNQW